VTFVDGKDLLWPKDGDISSTIMIGVREGVQYRLHGHPIEALVHDTIILCELWH
jgi:hypothetical protein